MSSLSSFVFKNSFHLQFHHLRVNLHKNVHSKALNQFELLQNIKCVARAESMTDTFVLAPGLISANSAGNKTDKKQKLLRKVSGSEQKSFIGFSDETQGQLDVHDEEVKSVSSTSRVLSMQSTFWRSPFDSINDQPKWL
jgi:hypothetical protein